MTSATLCWVFVVLPFFVLWVLVLDALEDQIKVQLPLLASVARRLKIESSLRSMHHEWFGGLAFLWVLLLICK